MDITLPLFDNNDEPITGGAASTSLKIRKNSNGYLFDWSDTTFKNAGWTTLATTFAEIDATNVAGYYHKEAVDISGWTDGWYLIVARYTGTPKRNYAAEWLVKGGKLIEQRTADNLDAQVSLIKTKTDQLTFTIANQVDSNTLTGGLDAAGVRSAVGMASANLDTQLSTISGYITTVISRIGAFTGTGINTVLGFLRALSRKDASLTPSDMGGTYDNTTDSLEAAEESGGGSTTINVMSATSGGIQVSYAKSGGTVQVVQGDTISIPYGPLGKDITGRKLYYGAKQSLSDTVFAIAVKEITAQIIDAATFTGTIPHTSDETGLTPGRYYAEMESRNSDGTTAPATEMKFILEVVDQVIT